MLRARRALSAVLDGAHDRHPGAGGRRGRGLCGFAAGRRTGLRRRAPGPRRCRLRHGRRSSHRRAGVRNRDGAAVDKIVGPGNIYVTAAKKLLAGEVGIDMVAGPTEVVLVAAGGKPEWLAADLMAQAEHDPQAAAILVTTSRRLAEAVAARIPARWKNCTALLAGSIEQALELANRIAPEHLSLADPRWAGQVRSAGSVFLGPYSTKRPAITLPAPITCCPPPEWPGCAAAFRSWIS